jgi:2-phospho-L-lactate guanylyltransferase
MRYRALIPVKSLQYAKSRLAPHLTQPQRAQLMLQMLQYTICTLQASESFERISVVSSDTVVLQRAREWGAIALPEEAPGHNPALHAAALHELAADVHKTLALLTISADLPLLRPCDIQNILSLAHKYDVVLAPSQEGTGTNALLVHPPLTVPYVFGENSLQHYIAEAQKRQRSYALYNSIGLALDIDTRENLEAYQQYQTEQNALSTSCFPSA